MALCEICQTLTFDRFLDEVSIRIRVLEELSQSSDRCILCRLIFMTIRRGIADFVEPRESIEETEKCLDELKSRWVSLRFPLVQLVNKDTKDRLYIDVEGPSLSIDGWPLLASSDTSLALMREPGEQRLSLW